MIGYVNEVPTTSCFCFNIYMYYKSLNHYTSL